MYVFIPSYPVVSRLQIDGEEAVLNLDAPTRLR